MSVTLMPFLYGKYSKFLQTFLKDNGFKECSTNFGFAPFSLFTQNWTHYFMKDLSTKVEQMYFLPWSGKYNLSMILKKDFTKCFFLS